jgi:GTPase SAR1 family protein
MVKAATRLDGAARLSAAPASASAEVEAAVRLANDLAASDSGAVRWPHARLIFLGTGNAGKTCTINALSGKTFVHSESTIGGQTSECVLEQQAVKIAADAREPAPFRPYEPPAEGEHHNALLAHAVEAAAGRAAPDGESMLAAATAACATPPPATAAGSASPSTASAGVTPSGRTAASFVASCSAGKAVEHSRPNRPVVATRAPAPTAPPATSATQATTKQATTTQATSAAVAAPRMAKHVQTDHVVKFAAKNARSGVVVNILDTAGQVRL